MFSYCRLVGKFSRLAGLHARKMLEVNEVTSRLLFLFIVIKFGTKVKKKRFKLAFNLNTSTFRFRTFCFFEYSAKFSQLLFEFSPIFFHFLKCKSGKSKADTFSLVLSPLEFCKYIQRAKLVCRHTSKI